MNAKTPEYIMDFIKAVYSDVPDLALASFSEKTCLEKATTLINSQAAALAEQEAEIARVKKIFSNGRMNYCSHTESCDIWGKTIDEHIHCTCGYDEWLAKLLPPDEPKEKGCTRCEHECADHLEAACMSDGNCCLLDAKKEATDVR